MIWLQFQLPEVLIDDPDGIFRSRHIQKTRPEPPDPLKTRLWDHILIFPMFSVFLFPRTFSAGWRLSLGWIRVGIRWESGVYGMCWRLDLTIIMLYAACQPNWLYALWYSIKNIKCIKTKVSTANRQPFVPAAAPNEEVFIRRRRTLNCTIYPWRWICKWSPGLKQAAFYNAPTMRLQCANPKMDPWAFGCRAYAATPAIITHIIIACIGWTCTYTL
jgi:hypothetical protein